MFNLFNLKQVSFSIATIAATVTVSALSPTAAKAVTITGTITGIWDIASGELTPGDPFTVTYSYDDTNLIYDSTSASASGSLLSLVLSSGDYRDVFNLNGERGSNSGTIVFSNTRLSVDAAYFTVLPSGRTSAYTYFRSERERGQLLSGKPYVKDEIETYKYRFPRAGSGPFGYTQSNVEFSPDPTAIAAAVPAPAVVPGWLLGLGLGVLGKRKAEAALKRQKA